MIDFRKIEQIPGWLDRGEADVFADVLTRQSEAGIVGDILEIGVFWGRSAAVEAQFLQPGEHLVLVDVFENGCGSEEGVWENLQMVLPDLDRDIVEFWVMRSQDFPRDRQFRFIYVDGGHTEADALADLRLGEDVLQDQGVMVVDDYGGTEWPGVTAAVDTFLAEGRFEVMLDMVNAADGRKVYLVRR